MLIFILQFGEKTSNNEVTNKIIKFIFNDHLCKLSTSIMSINLANLINVIVQECLCSIIWSRGDDDSRDWFLVGYVLYAWGLELLTMYGCT